MAKAKSSRSAKKKDSGVDQEHGLVAQDELHAVRLLEELDAHHGVEAATLDIGIREGKALARGAVSDQDELDRLQETLTESGGIDDFESFVQIAPTRREADRDRARLLQEALDAEADVAAGNISVACMGKRAVVRGTAPDMHAKVKAGLMVLAHAEVSRLRNRVVIVATN